MTNVGALEATPATSIALVPAEGLPEASVVVTGAVGDAVLDVFDDLCADFRSFQILSDPFRSFQILSDPFRFF